MNIDFRRGEWLNRPATSEVSEYSLTMTTEQKTDFWRETHYGFTRDTGHFLGFTTADGFTATIRIQGEFRSLYDQAGLMVRIDEKRWVKTGVEYTDGQAFLSTVVTDGKSDWSVSQPFEALEDFYIRVTLANGALRIQASRDGSFWPLLRLARSRLPIPTRLAPRPVRRSEAGLSCASRSLQLTRPPAKTFMT